MPGLTPDQVLEKLRSFSKDIDALNPSFRGLLGQGLIDDEVAHQVADGFPLGDERSRLEAELARARQDVVRIEADLAAAEQALTQARQQTKQAQSDYDQANKVLSAAGKSYDAAKKAYKQVNSSTPSAIKDLLKRQLENAAAALQKANEAKVQAQARIRAAQAEEKRIRQLRDDLRGQLGAAQRRVRDLEGRLQSLAHQMEVQQLLHQLRAVTDSLSRSGLPKGLSAREVPGLFLSESRRDSSSD